MDRQQREEVRAPATTPPASFHDVTTMELDGFLRSVKLGYDLFIKQTGEFIPCLKGCSDATNPGRLAL